MDFLTYTKQRLTAFCDQLDVIAQSEFAYPDSKDVLSATRNLFEKYLSTLGFFTKRTYPPVIRRMCSIALHKLFLFHPIAGLILRSTNIRNAFEVVHPLKLLASQLLDDKTQKHPIKLILSSEWEYAPFSFQAMDDLESVVMIGLPASESANPFVLPLAGHELAHTAWRRNSLDDYFRSILRDKVIAMVKEKWKEFAKTFNYPHIKKQDQVEGDIFAAQVWSPAIDLAVRQAEEVFCDAFGLYVFKTSYIYAFTYLLAPGLEGPRSIRYPLMLDRISYREKAAKFYNIITPSNFSSQFDDDQMPLVTPTDLYRLNLADDAVKSIVDNLIRKAKEVIDRTPLTQASTAEPARILRDLKRAVPAEHGRSLADILNAAWQAHEDKKLWKEFPEVHLKRHQILKELVLKNIEVFDIEQILKGSNAPKK